MEEPAPAMQMIQLTVFHRPCLDNLQQGKATEEANTPPTFLARNVHLVDQREGSVGGILHSMSGLKMTFGSLWVTWGMTAPMRS